MKFSLDKQEDHIVVKLQEPKLNSLVAPIFKSEMILLNTEGMHNIILDLSDVSYCDSSGLSCLLVTNRLCKSGGGNFILANIQPTVEKLIKISQLDTVFNISSSVEEGVAFALSGDTEKKLGN